MADIKSYLQNDDGNNLLPITDFNYLLNTPAVLQSPDKILTGDNFNDVLKMTSHELTIGSTFAGTGKLLTFQLNGVPFWSISLVVHPTADWTMDSTTPVCTTPDISDDVALSGSSYGLNWKYLTAHIYQDLSNTYSFVFHDGHGYTSGGGSTITADTNIMVFGTQMFI